MRNFSASYRAGRRGLLALAVTGSLLAAAPARAQVPAPGWQAAVAAAGEVLVQATALDASGNVLLAGSFSSGTATFGSTVLSTTNSQELFVAKWSPSAGSFVWAVQGSGLGAGANSANAVAVSGGNVYLAGGFSSASLQLGSLAPLATAGGSDIFVAKLVDAGSSASFSSAVQAGGAGSDYASALLVINSDLYVGGVNGAGAVFNNGSGGPSTLASAGGFIARTLNIGSLGSLQYPTPAGDAVTALAYNGNIYATGTFRTGSATFGSPYFTTPPITLTSAGGEDAFVARFSSFQLLRGWVQGLGGTGDDYGQALLSSGNALYLAGVLKSPTVALGTTTLASTSAGNLFVTRLTDTNTQGTYQWALQGGGAGSAANRAASLAATGTSVYLAGSLGGTASFGSTTLTSAGASDVLLAKLTDQGTSAAFTWAQQAGGSGPDYGNSLVRSGTQLYVAGQATSPATFGSQAIGTSAGVRPGFVATAVDAAPLLTLAAPTSVPVGSAITLYGTGLAGTTAITFAGTSNNVVTAGFTVNAAGTQISGIVVPAGAQSGVVNATTPLGTSNGLVTFGVTASANSAPAWQAAVPVPTPVGTSSIQYSAADASGNVVVAGLFSGTISLGGATLTSAGGDDVFVAKWSPATNSYVWAQRLGSAGTEYFYGLAVSGANVYLAGSFPGATLSASNSALTLTNTTGTQGNLDGFVVKLTDIGSSASTTWMQRFGGNYNEYVGALAVSGTSVYVAGDYDSDALTVTTGNGSGTLPTNASSDDGFVAKLVDAGTSTSFGWLLQAGSSGNNFSTVNFYGLAVQGTTLYAAGTLYGTVSLGGTQLAAQGDADALVVRITDAGSSASFTSAVRAGGPGITYAFDLKNKGTALYLGGYTTSPTSTWGGTTLTTAGPSSGYVAKLTDTSAGLAFGWVQPVGSYTAHLAVNGSNVYAAGYFVGTASFGPTTLISEGSREGYVAKLVDAGTSGSVAWAQQSGGPGNDTNNTVAVGVSDKRLYVGGSVVPAAAFGSVVLLAPAGQSVATLATLTDPTILATAPAASARAGGLTLYPNPAHGRTTAQLPASAEQLPLLLYNAMGREVRRYPAPGSAATEAPLSLVGLAPGVYVLRCGASSQRLLVE